MKNLEKSLIVEKNKLIIYMIGLSLLLVIRDIANFSINKYILLLYCVIFFIISKKETLIYMIIFLFPLLWGMPDNFVLTAWMIVYIIKNKKINKNSFLFIACFVFLEVLASFWYIKTEPSDIFKYLVTISIFFTLLYDNKKIDFKKAIIVYLLGSALLCTVIIINTISTAPSNWMSMFAKGKFRFGYLSDEKGVIMLRTNANNLAYYSVVGLALSIFLLLKSHKKIIYILLLLIHFIAGALTLSRTWVLVTVLLAVIILFSQFKNMKSAIMSILFIVIASFMSYFYLQNNSQILQGFMTRFTSNDLTSGGERIDLFEEYYEIFTNNSRLWITGSGVMGYKEVINAQNSFHNMIEQIIVSYGLFGGIIFFIGMLKPAFIKRKKKILAWIPFIAVILFTQTIQFVNPTALMLPYVVAIYTLKIDAYSND